MRQKRWTALLVGFALAATIGGAALAVNQGSQADPLVTLSYLNDVVVPDILKQVDAKLEQSGGTAQSSFVTVSVPSGKSLKLSAGAQMVFRSGTAAPSVALTDLTAGGSASTLSVNHLYLATADTTVSASQAATVLVLGSYSVN